MTVISLNYRSESEQRAIREQLARIINSAAFLQSRRRQRFLEYIVNETLAGRGERLKGYNVALAVFDRPNTFDSAVDPIVRIEASRLREKAPRILRGRRPERSHSHRSAQGQIHPAHRVPAATEICSFASTCRAGAGR